MNDEVNQLGIEDTLEVFDFLITAIDDLAAAKDSSGKISLISWAKIAIKEAPAVVVAIRGVEQIPVELKNLDQAEVEQLADRGLQLTNAIMHLMGISKQ